MNTDTKHCPDCGQTKPVSEYYTDNSRKDKLCPYCIPCTKKRNKEYRSKNRDKELERKRKWKAENPEKAKATDRAYRQANSERERERQALWRQRNPEKACKKTSKYRARKCQATDPTHNEGYELLLREQARIAKDILGEDWHLDHIVPLAKGGKHHHSNMQLLPAKLNFSKQDSLTWRHPDFLPCDEDTFKFTASGVYLSLDNLS